MVLFLAIGIVASDYFCPNISTVAQLLHLSPDLAAVTLVALGNASPDLISNLVALSRSRDSETGALALGELVGAGLFLSCAVVGLLGIVAGNITVTRKAVVRDQAFYVIGLVFVGVVVVVGVQMWHGVLMLALYAAYIVTVLGMHRRPRPLTPPLIVIQPPDEDVAMDDLSQSLPSPLDPHRLMPTAASTDCNYTINYN